MTTFDELIHLWKETPSTPPGDLDARIGKVRAEAVRLGRQVLIRDLSEIGSGFSVGLFFLGFGIYFGGTILAGALLAMPFIIFVMVFLLHSRRQQAKEDRAPRESLRDEVNYQLRALERQDRLLRTVVFWYIAPLGMALLTFLGGIVLALPKADVGFLTMYGLVTLGLMVATWFINVRTADKTLQPQIREVQDLLKDLEAEDTPRG